MSRIRCPPHIVKSTDCGDLDDFDMLCIHEFGSSWSLAQRVLKPKNNESPIWTGICPTNGLRELRGAHSNMARPNTPLLCLLRENSDKPIAHRRWVRRHKRESRIDVSGAQVIASQFLLARNDNRKSGCLRIVGERRNALSAGDEETAAEAEHADARRKDSRHRQSTLANRTGAAV